MVVARNILQIALFIAAWLIIMLAAAPLHALTTDQVIRLRRAGVSNETIEKMIQAETNARLRGYAGRYVVRQQNGNQVVVYEASSPKGVVDYPTNVAAEAGGVDRVSTALGFPTRVKAEGGVVSKTQGYQVSQGLPGGGYTVHLTSYKNRKYAQRDAAVYRKQGLDAAVHEVVLREKGTMYRVSVGSFKSSKAARAYGRKLKSEGTVGSYWVGRK